MFLISIIKTDGTRVRLRPGGRGEREFISTATAAILAKGVGFLKTEAHVKAAIEQGLTETLLALKSEVVP